MSAPPVPEVADHLSVPVDAELSGNVDEPSRRGGLDYMGVAGRLR